MNLEQTVLQKIKFQWKTLKKAFSDLNQEKSGAIKPIELRHFLNNWGLFVTEEQFKKIFSHFDQDGDGVWAGYTSPEENDVKDIGVKCSNCVFFQGPNACSIISLEVEADGKCRFAVIPEGVVSVKPEYKGLEEEIEEYMLEKELMVDIKNKEDYASAEDAILAMTEYSGYGYEAEAAIRASWLRAVRNGDDPFLRAGMLSVMGVDSLDGNLLPTLEEDGE